MPTRKPCETATVLAAAALCGLLACGSVLAAKKPAAKPEPKPAATMSVEQARKIAEKTATYKLPPRTIADIAKVLDENKPDPAKIAALQKAAEAPTPANLNGMAKALFLEERARAARDLGRTQQRVADLRAAYAIARPYAKKGGPISVFDFPNRSNPQGSAAFRAYANALHAARGGGGGNANLPPCGRRDDMNCRHGPGGGGGGGGRAGPIDYLSKMPHSPDEAKEKFRRRVSADSEHAVRIMQDLIVAEVDTGNFKNAVDIYEDVRPALLTVWAGPVLQNDIRFVSIKLRAGDVEGAKRSIARAQQIYGAYRQQSEWAYPFFNGMNSYVEQGLGEVALATGQLGEAEARFHNSIRLRDAVIKDIPQIFINQPPPSEVESTAASVRLLLAQSLYRQNKLIEAEAETRRALLDLLRLHGNQGPVTARTVLILADIVQAQGRYRGAQRLAEIALDIYVRAGVEPALHADALSRIATAQAALGHWQEAMATYDRLKAAVAKDEVARKKYFEVNLDLAVSLLRSGQGAAAIPIVQGAIKKRTAEGADEYAIAEARGFLGSALAAAGRQEEALRTLHEVIPVLLAASDSSVAEEGAVDRANRRQLIVENYFALLTAVRATPVEQAVGIDAADEAFRMADAAHAKSVQSAIAASSARSASSDDALGKLIRETQDTDRRIAALADLMRATLEAPADAQDRQALQAMQADSAQLKQARATLRKEIEKRFPQYSALVSPKPVGIAEARATLLPGEALIVTYFSGGRGYVWALRRQGDVVFAPIGLGESDITKLTDRLLAAVNPDAALLTDIPAFDVAAAHKLYAALLEPVASGWRGADTLIVVPHGTLGRLPFAMLVTKEAAQPAPGASAPLFAGYRDVAFLVRDVATTQLPSVAALKSLREMPAGAASRKAFIGFGDPYFSVEQAEDAKRETEAPVQVAMRGGALKLRAAPKIKDTETAALAQLPRLPDTAEEVREVARALNADPQNDVLLGVKASEKTVRSMPLDDRRVVMFATHGLIPGELDGLMQPALALSSPAIAGVEGDGLLTVDKILGLKLDADWVVLSACNTAAGEASGAEAVSGLGRAFFYAGARALLVTQWPVETSAARALTTDLFRRQSSDATLSRAGALRAAMLDMLDKGERVDPATQQVVFTYAHPLFWAPFALVGDGQQAAAPKN
jgi:CHAT domain-containing protein